MHDVSRLYMQGCSDGVFTFKGIAFHKAPKERHEEAERSATEETTGPEY